MVKKWNLDFTLGFISCADGERDPRCLLLVFNLSKVIATEINLEHLAEDFFEVIASYFPIDFTPVSCIIESFIGQESQLLNPTIELPQYMTFDKSLKIHVCQKYVYKYMNMCVML